MHQLDLLPKELLSEIFYWIPYIILPSVASNCQVLYRIAVPHFYGCVYLKYNDVIDDKEEQLADFCK